MLLLCTPFLCAMELSTPHVQSTMHEDLKKFSANTNILVHKLIDKLKKAEKFKKPKWPIVLFRENNTQAKKFAIQMGHELGRKPVVLMPENVSDEKKIKEIKKRLPKE